MQEITIRFAVIADAALIADLSRQTFYTTFAAQNSPENMNKFMTEQFSREALINEVSAPGNIFLLAYQGEEPVGYARLRENNNPPELGTINAIEIARLYAVPGYIGTGVGSLLMQQCIRLANEKNAAVLWLGVWQENTRAIDFYTRWGFTIFSTHVFMLGDDPQQDWLMKKQL